MNVVIGIVSIPLLVCFMRDKYYVVSNAMID